MGEVCGLGLGTAGLGGARLTPLGVAIEERFGLSWLFAVRGRARAPADAVVVSLDRESAERLGLPEKISDWPRDGPCASDRAPGRGRCLGDRVRRDFQPAREPAQDRGSGAGDRRCPPGRAVRVSARGLPRAAGRQWRGQRLLAAKQWRPPLPELVGRGRRYRAVSSCRGAPTGSASSGPSPRGSASARTLPVVALQRHAVPVLADWARLLREAGAGGAGRSGPRSGRNWRGPALAAFDAQPRLVFLADATLGARLRAGLEEAPLDGGTRRLFAALIRLYEGPDSRYLNFYGPTGRVRTIPCIA